MKYLAALLLLGCLSSSCLAQLYDCSDADVDLGPFQYVGSNAKQHVSGQHLWEDFAFGQCIYTDPPQGNKCNNTDKAHSVIDTISDTGPLQGSGYHVFGEATFAGVASSNGGGVQAGTEAAVSVMNCPTLDCGVTVTISGSVNGLGLTVTDPPSAVWNDKYAYTSSCIAQSYCGGSCQCGGCQPGYCGNCYISPLLIDTTGRGYHMSNPAESCAKFDLEDNGNPRCWAWPVVGSGNGWLVLPDKDGRVYNSKQLFGSKTPQPHHPNKKPNGFLALAEWDSNFDLVIDKRDPIWSELRVWVSNGHCTDDPSRQCEAQPDELHLLSEFGISSIGLVYEMSDKPAQFKSQFKLKSTINVDTKRADRQHSLDKSGRTIYDVYPSYKKQ